jgi:hypothetical protein
MILVFILASFLISSHQMCIDPAGRQNPAGGIWVQYLSGGLAARIRNQNFWLVVGREAPG